MLHLGTPLQTPHKPCLGKKEEEVLERIYIVPIEVEKPHAFHTSRRNVHVSITRKRHFAHFQQFLAHQAIRIDIVSAEASDLIKAVLLNNQEVGARRKSPQSSWQLRKHKSEEVISSIFCLANQGSIKRKSRTCKRDQLWVLLEFLSYFQEQVRRENHVGACKEQELALGNLCSEISRGEFVASRFHYHFRIVPFCNV
jgi:hypothetical protein